MGYCYVKFNEYEELVCYGLYQDLVENCFYWKDETHDRILPELFHSKARAMRWIEDCVDEIGGECYFTKEKE